MGYRYLDVRVELNKEGTDLLIVHNFGDCRSSRWPFSKGLRFADVVETVLSFLEKHPGETVMMCVKPENKDNDVSAVQALVQKSVTAHEDAFWAKESVPTLGEARGKIVLMRRYADVNGCGDLGGIDTRWRDQHLEEEREDTSLSYRIHSSGSLTYAVQDRYKYGVEDKKAAVSATMASTELQGDRDILILNFLTTVTGASLPHPRAYARDINNWFRYAVSLTAGGHYGVIILDWATADLALKVIQTNF